MFSSFFLCLPCIHSFIVFHILAVCKYCGLRFISKLRHKYAAVIVLPLPPSCAISPFHSPSFPSSPIYTNSHLPFLLSSCSICPSSCPFVLLSNPQSLSQCLAQMATTTLLFTTVATPTKQVKGVPKAPFTVVCQIGGNRYALEIACVQVWSITLHLLTHKQIVDSEGPAKGPGNGEVLLCSISSCTIIFVMSCPC